MQVKKLIPDLQRFLKEGVLRDEYVLDNIQKLMNVMREANVTLRWMMLHNAPLPHSADGNKRCRQIREQVLQDSAYHQETLFRLMLNTGQFEFKLKEVRRRYLCLLYFFIR